MAAALLLLVLLFLGERCGSYANFQGELDACLGPLLSGRGVTPAPVWGTQPWGPAVGKWKIHKLNWQNEGTHKWSPGLFVVRYLVNMNKKYTKWLAGEWFEIMGFLLRNHFLLNYSKRLKVTFIGATLRELGAKFAAHLTTWQLLPSVWLVFSINSRTRKTEDFDPLLVTVYYKTPAANPS